MILTQPINPVTAMMNAITPYEARYKQHENFTVTFNILMLTFFFAYMGYKFLMDYTKSQDRWEARMKTLEEHMETIEENATYINNELVNSSEQIKEFQKEMRVIKNKVMVLYKYAHEFDNNWHSEQWKDTFEREMTASETMT